MNKTEPALQLFDNTRLSAHASCNRAYYYRHRRNLTSSGFSPPLTFGAAWHGSMDAIWTAILHNDLSPLATFQAGMENFYAEWQRDGCPLEEQMDLETRERFKKGKRTFENAEFLLQSYIGARFEYLKRNFKLLLHTERPFAVPIGTDNSVLYCGKIDKIVLYQGSIWAIEHKTTGSGSGKSGFYGTWTEQWSNNRQVDGYIHALHMLYGNQTRGVIIDGALISGKSTETHFDFIPIEKAADTLDGWLYDVHSEISRIRANVQAEGRSIAPTMQAWPRNTNSCIDYGSVCPWIGFCRTLSDPSALDDETLLRYNANLTIRKWSPFDAARLEELGLTREMSGEL